MESDCPRTLRADHLRSQNDTNYSIARDPACLIPAEVLHHLIENVRVFIVDVLVEIGPRL